MYLEDINVGWGGSRRRWLSLRKEEDHISKTRVLKRVCLEKSEERTEEAGPDLTSTGPWVGC